MSYSQQDREMILEQAENEKNKKSFVTLAFACNMYDVMRLQLEELHRIGDTMESIYEIICSERQNQ